MPIISAIVPAYNSGNFLGDAIESLTSQTLDDIEIIVVDDCSTDDTALVAERYGSQDRRVRVIHSEFHAGRPASVRNIGLRAARGEYIAFLDADDIAVPSRLASCVDAMQQTGSQLAFADYRKLYQDSGQIERTTVLESMQFIRRAADYLVRVSENVFLCTPSFPAFLLTCVAVNTPTIAFRRQLLDAEPYWFDESTVCFEDVDLWLRLAAHTPFVFVNEVHGLNRRHSDSLTASNPVSTRLDGIAVRKAHLKRLSPTLSPKEIATARQTIADLLWDVAYTNWCSGQLREARSRFIDSWRTKPSRRAATGYFKSFIPRDVALTAADSVSSWPSHGRGYEFHKVPASSMH